MNQEQMQQMNAEREVRDQTRAEEDGVAIQEVVYLEVVCKCDYTHLRSFRSCEYCNKQNEQ